VPYLFATGIIPPLRVVNELLRRGVSDAGMSGSCVWEPFEITTAEWPEVRSALEALPAGQRYVEPPPEVRDYLEWLSWIFERLYGVPAAEHLRLARREERLAALHAKAREDGDDAAAQALHTQRLKVGMELTDLLMEHVRRDR
jgi:hypothetical protein